MTDGPRLIGRKEAAAYCGIGESTFSLWVSTHKMPPAVPGTRKWDKKAIDAKLDEISGLDVVETKPVAPRSAYETVSKPLSNYEAWKQAKLARREKYKPLFNLDAASERALRHLADNPACDTVDTIPEASNPVLKRLGELGLLRVVSMTGKLFRYAVTEEGKAELHRLKKWKSLTP